MDNQKYWQEVRIKHFKERADRGKQISECCRIISTTDSISEKEEAKRKRDIIEGSYYLLYFFDWNKRL